LTWPQRDRGDLYGAVPMIFAATQNNEWLHGRKLLITAILPSITCVGFVFINIPALGQRLCERHDGCFDEYARRTAKLVPFIY
jgi:hypothetical protein